MSSGHWQNTGLAKWISDNLYQYNTSDEKSMNPRKWYSIQNGGNLNDTRETINGFPCRLILINDGETPLNEGQNEPTPGNVKDMGIFNFNNDKGNTDTFGLDNSIFPRCASYEVVANSDTSAGAFVPFEKIYTIGVNNSNTSLVYFNQLGYNDGDSITFTNLGTSTAKLQFYYNKNWKVNYNVEPNASKTITMGSNTGDMVHMQWGAGDNGWLVNDAKLLPNRTEGVSIETLVPIGDELAYLQDSFELRYPDDKEVGADYGMLGMMMEALTTDYYIAGGGTLYWSVQIEHDYFGTNELTVSDNVADAIGYNNNNEIQVIQKRDGKINIKTSSEFPYIAIRWKEPFEYCEVNGRKLYAGKEVSTNTIKKNPSVTTSLSSNYGLKRVIDWVGNATDEEFVANFEQYFNKEYTFRYYLLVITLGMVDNLGGHSCRV